MAYYISELDQIENIIWTEYRIPNYSVFENYTNTKYQIIRFLKMNEYRIVLSGLNYLNRIVVNFICEICDQMR